MTGNTKVWRAPLAGLAAAAMLATMGVAAGTANAATFDPSSPSAIAKYDFKVTFDANGGTVLGSSDVIKASDTGSDLADGYLTYTPGTYALAGRTAKKSTNSGAVFTGWYTKDGVKFDPNTFINADTTLYAHYADPGELDTFTFTLGTQAKQAAVKNGFQTYASDNDFKVKTVTGTTTIKVARTDRIPSWELPVDKTGDSQALTGWKTATGSSLDENTAVSFDQLTGDLSAIAANKGKDQTYRLTPTTTAATSVRFWIGGLNTYEVDVPFNSAIAVPTGEDAFNASAKLRATTYKESTVNGATVNGALTASDSLNANYAKDNHTTSTDDAKYWDVDATDAQQAFHVTYLSEINGIDRPYTQRIVDQGQVPEQVSPSGRTGFLYDTDSAQPTASPAFTHKNSDEQFAGKVGAHTLLVAQWGVKNAGVTFDLSYGDKSFDESHQAGEVFNLPQAGDSRVARDGWSLYGWYVDQAIDGSGVTTYTSPFSKSTSYKTGYESQFGYYNKTVSTTKPATASSRVDGLKNLSNGVYTTDAYAQYRMPDNTRLRLNDQGQLQWENTKYFTGKYDDTTGNPIYTTTWVTIPGRLYAAWVRADSSQLQGSLDRLPVNDDKGNGIDYSVYFKNWNAVRPEIDSLRAEIANGKSSLTADEVGKLVAKLDAAYAKLEVKTDQVVYRAYNKNDGDHYFTAKKFEYDGLVKLGWNPEGKKFQVVSAETVDKASVDLHPYLTAVNSVYNSYTGEHLLVGTTEAATLEKAGWTWDNDKLPVFYTPKAGGEQGLYRAYNPYTRGPAHVYTADTVKELPNVIKAGWLADNNSQPLFFVDKTAD